MAIILGLRFFSSKYPLVLETRSISQHSTAICSQLIHRIPNGRFLPSSLHPAQKFEAHVPDQARELPPTAFVHEWRMAHLRLQLASTPPLNFHCRIRKIANSMRPNPEEPARLASSRRIGVTPMFHHQPCRLGLPFATPSLRLISRKT